MKNEDQLDAIFGALSHSTRRAMLTHLRNGEASVGELAGPHGMSLPAISRHLKVLEKAGLIGRSIDGKFRSCYLRPETVTEAGAWLDEHRRFWTQQLDALDEFAQELMSEAES